MANDPATDDVTNPPVEDRRFSLRLLGPPSLSQADGSLLGGLGPGKTLAMLAYLAVRRRARRDELIELLWGGVLEANARNAFRQSLHRLRTALGEAAIPQDREVVSLVTEAVVSIDRDAFVEQCEAEHWAEAVEAYAGDFLEGFELEESAFDRWAEGERMRLRTKFQEAVRQAGQSALENGRFADAIRWAERLSAIMPYDEGAAVFEATVLASAGRAAEALGAARRFVARIGDELDLPAPASIQSVIARLQKTDSTSSPATASSERGKGSRAPAPFVGRSTELSQLLAALADLKAQRGQTILVEGEPGIGKSRLLDEFASRGRALVRVLVLRGRERPLATALPYAGVAEALRSIVHAPGVAGTSRHLLAEAARILPELRDSFDLPSPQTESVSDEAARLRFFEGVGALVESVAFEQPVCILIDDLHNASTSSLDLLLYLAGRLQASPVLFVVTYRTDGSHAGLAERIRAVGSASRLLLDPLSDSESEELARACAVRGELSPAELERVVRVANGRPLAVMELARRLRVASPATESVVGMRDILWARLQAASPSQRRLFFAAALLERSASLRLLAAAAHLPEGAALDAAEELDHAGLLAPTECGYIVAHDTTRSFIVDSSGLAGRALLAGWAAEALALEDDATDAELANLYALAGRSKLAFDHARRAAFRAASLGAMHEVTRLLTMALTFAPDADARIEVERLLGAFDRSVLSLPAARSDIDPASEQGVEREAESDQAEAATHTGPASAPPVGPAADNSGYANGLPSLAQRLSAAHQWFMAVGISLIVVLLGLIARRQLANAAAGTAVPGDTLLVTKHAAGGAISYAAAIGSKPAALESTPAPAAAWYDSLRSPWSDRLPAPNGHYVAVGRVTSHGKDLVLLSQNRRDTLTIASGGGDNGALDWSPDSRSLLISRARTLADGSFDTDLLVYHVDQRSLTPIDTSADRAVSEAKWSPDGTRIAWVARLAPSRQRDVYIAYADGSATADVSANPADDHDIVWSPDGSLLTFTSNRGGSSGREGPRRIYAYDLEHRRLWPVTSAGGDSHARFSPDGRWLAFESTRDGDAAVYLTRPLGGSVVRITPAGSQFSLEGWRGRTPAYIEKLRIIGASIIGVGDTAHLSLFTIDQFGSIVPSAAVQWTVIDRASLKVISPNEPSARLDIAGLRPGESRVVASIPGWRSDTVVVSVGSSQGVGISDDFRNGLDQIRWMPLGAPLPYVGRGSTDGARVLYPNGDLEWDSGALLRQTIELRPQLDVSFRMVAPFTGHPTSATLTAALVAAMPLADIDRNAPMFKPLVGVVWDGASGTLTYSVGRESSSDVIGAPGNALANPSSTSHMIGIHIAAGGSVTFTLDGQTRWRSALRLIGEAEGSQVRFWIGGHASGSIAGVGAVSVRLAPQG